MRLLAVAALLAAIALVPGSAQAARTQITTETVMGGPQLAGDLAVFEQVRGGSQVVRAAGPGTPARTLFSDPIPRNDPDDDCCFTYTGFDWSVSSNRLAVQTATFNSAKGMPVNGDAALAAGPLDGPHQSLYACDTQPEASPGPFDVDGDRIAFARGACGEPMDIVVRDLGSGATVATVPPAPAGSRYVQLVLAGRYLAILARANNADQQSDGTVVVRDLVRGVNVTSARTNGHFDLQGDGKLVTVATTPGPDGCRTSVGWYAPGDPAPRALGFCPAARPRIAASRILMKVDTPARAAGSAELVLSDLNGVARPLVVSDAADTIGTDYDLTANRAAYSTDVCGPGGVIYTDDLAPADPLRVRHECNFRLLGKRLRAARNATVTVRVRCANGCGGEVQLRPRRGNKRLTPYKGFETRGGTVRVKLKLRKPARRALARNGRLKARIIANSSHLANGSNFVRVQPVTLVGRRR